MEFVSIQKLIGNTDLVRLFWDLEHTYPVEELEFDELITDADYVLAADPEAFAV
jgi:hypothetical protein